MWQDIIDWPQRGRKEGAEMFWAAFGSEEIPFCRNKPLLELSFTFATGTLNIHPIANAVPTEKVNLGLKE